MRIHDPSDRKNKQNPYTYVNGIGFISDRQHAERRQLLAFGSLFFFSFLLYFLLQRFLLLPSYYLSAMLGTDVWFNPMTGLMTMSETAAQTAALIRYTVSFAAVLLLVWLCCRKELSFRQMSWMPDLTYGSNSFLLLCGAAVIGMFGSELFVRLLRQIGMVMPTGSYTPPAALPAFILYLFNIVLLPALFEELFFRGFLLQCFRRFDELFAISVTTILFALLQPSIYDAIYALFFGAALGYIALKNGGLIICMTASLMMRSLRLTLWVLEHQNESAQPKFLLLLILLLLLVAACLAFLRRVSRNPHAFDLKEDESSLPNRAKLRILAINPLLWCICIYSLIRMLSGIQFIN